MTTRRKPKMTIQRYEKFDRWIRCRRAMACVNDGDWERYMQFWTRMMVLCHARFVGDSV